MGSVKATFQSTPDAVLREFLFAVKRDPEIAEFADLLQWENREKTRATASKSGASFTLEIKGKGPTELLISFRIGFPAFLKYREHDVKGIITNVICEVEKKIT